MKSQSLQGIAVGRSNELDCMMMYCPFNQKVYHTSNYRDGVHIWGFVISVSADDPSQKFPPPQHNSYTIRFVEDTIKQVSPSTMASITPSNKDQPTLQSSQLVLPQWIGD
eukprot:15365589-Ditylum_brightwellii.AAC.1